MLYNEFSIGEMLAQAFDKVGKDGVITVEEAKNSSDLELEMVEGLNLDRGYLSPYFVTNKYQRQNLTCNVLRTSYRRS